MILILKFIFCAHYNTDEHITRRVHGNRDIRYKFIISSHDKSEFRPYDELENSFEILNQLTCIEMEVEPQQANSTVEHKSKSSSNPIFLIKKDIFYCKRIIKEYKDILKMKSKMIKKENLKIKKSKTIEEFCINCTEEDTHKKIQKIYDLKKEHCRELESNGYKMLLNDYNIEIFSLFKHIPIIETLEKMTNKIESYKYNDKNIILNIMKTLDSLKATLDLLAIESEKVIKNYEKLNQIYDILKNSF
ncbi:uncharacterized protein VNE69_01202 [Vairimorpha necatrix]|uniref:Uncharacterized protein n=1 Tax=Vairimorpha necatrix TaxID=6039 RepID=A0AAX4J8N3_9MICR